MRENGSRVVEIEVLSLTEVLINGKNVKSSNSIFHFTYDDLIDSSILGFNRMHKKLEMILASVPGLKKVKIEDIISLIANSSSTRISHIEQSIGIPRYVAKKIFSELVQAKACVMSGGLLKKTQEYYSAIRDFDVRQRERSRKDVFIVPAEFDEVPGAATPPLCNWELKNLYRLREDAIEHGVEKSKMEPIHRQISLKEEEAKEREKERLEEIMKERNVGELEAGNILDEELFGETHTQTKGDDEEWRGNEGLAESEEEEERQTNRKKKGTQTRTKKNVRKKKLK